MATMQWRQLISKYRILWAVMSLFIFVLATLVGYTLLHDPQQRRLLASPERGATLATAELLSTADHLQKSFSASENSAQVTKDYLGYMKAMRQDCSNIRSYDTAAQRAKAAEATISRLQKSILLCKDLSEMAANSSTIYTAALPLLSASPKLKRYETLPPFSARIRNQQTAAIALSIKQLSGPVKTMEYPTQSVTLLEQLQTSVQNSSGLAYYPALQTFQRQLLAERQRYWTDFGDLSGLSRTLQVQLNRYCQNLPTEDAQLPACRH